MSGRVARNLLCTFLVRRTRECVARGATKEACREQFVAKDVEGEPNRNTSFRGGDPHMAKKKAAKKKGTKKKAAKKKK